MIVKLLIWIGITRRKQNGALFVPFHIPSYDMFRFHCSSPGNRFYVFRNLPGVIKWTPGRLLPRRWGFGICGFEFGDRG